jgi:hypothetical protein
MRSCNYGVLTINYLLRFQVLMTTSVKMAVFCDVATCSQVEIDHVSQEPSTSISEMLLTAKVTNRTDFFRTVQMLSFLYGIK